MIRILIVDDHQIIRNGIRLMLRTVPEFNVIAEAENGIEAVEYVEKNAQNIDVILMDISMPKLDGIGATKLIKEKFPELKIIALTMHLEESYIKDMIKSGASGYMLKESDKSVVAKAINLVAQGGNYIDKEAENFLKH
ncbi:MAG: response regulator transcription factor [Flavobacteriales bacterium]|nr:response regulator transcription factor [Flavobacteriales bacterium]MCW8912797.1 response regulator transcription factor [Flavobacteriales bacterium]MCW8938801.1 response regulator transcription factor [Flavobacteriales bacterium]MCW8940968.1 response regulator transcription factor [Flavobacteriales bacterium]MCW8968511.1 response regulator transcription factor [Flavobacteriales bacterium]